MNPTSFYPFLMTDLVAVISPNPNEFKHVEKVIQGQPWGKVYLVASQEHSLTCTIPPRAEVIWTDFTKPISEVIAFLCQSLKPKLSGTEIGLNLISGNGKEHMALLSAVLQCGVGFRLVALTKEGVVEI